ncbi:ubiquitin-like small modifier protein 1 [Chloroflexota bacterium]
MQVNFYATLREIVGGKTVEFPLPDDATVTQLLAILLERYPALSEVLLEQDGRLRGHVHLLVNGRDVQFLENGMDSVLSPKDTISIFPAIGGG